MSLLNQKRAETFKGKAVLLLGGGLMQVPAIKEALALGLVPVVMDQNAAAPGMRLAAHRLLVSLSEVEAAKRAALQFHQRHNLAAVLTVGTDFSLTVAKIAHHLGLSRKKRLALTDAAASVNKIKMRQRFAAAGLAQPRFLGFAGSALTKAALKQLRQQLRFPLVVKPADAMGARGVQRVDTEAELVAAYKKGFFFSRAGELIVEEYLPGAEYSLDALVYRGEIFIRGLARRMIAYPPYFVEIGHYLPAEGDLRESGEELTAELLAEMQETFKAGIRALGIENGAAKGDLRLVKQSFLTHHPHYRTAAEGRRLFIGEIAARLSGGFMSGYTTPYSCGVKPVRAALEISLGQPPSNLTPRFSRWVMERALFSAGGAEGVVRSITGVEEALHQPGVKAIFMHLKKGAVVRKPENNLMKCGNVICEAESKRQLLSRMRRVLSSIVIKTNPH